MNIIGDLSMEELDKIKGMTRAGAEEYIADRQLDEAERTAVLSLAGIKRTFAATQHHPDRKVWLAAAWLLGASYRQLATAEGITQQTILRYVDRVLPSEERKHGRLGTSMTLEALSTYHAKFLTIDLVDPRPRVVAQWLLDNTELDR